MKRRLKRDEVDEVGVVVRALESVFGGKYRLKSALVKMSENMGYIAS